ncbi:hypothetical protein [Cupriavidus sp. BIC8F]|uniref:hypothetical protein n=1 Tax=Cupriavidus sp. BIC8F TaxID=3079014 RepID=UPI002916659C|nr:hypothetical protein [Cupriavidus sp. BIC8F]
MPTQIDFENFPAGTLVLNLYAGKGVVFPWGGIVNSDSPEGKPHSGNNFLFLFGGSPKPLVFFTGPSYVALWAGTRNSPQGATAWGHLEAWDASGTLLGGTTQQLVVNACDTQLQVNAPGKFIASVTLSLVGIGPDGMAFNPYATIDDLAFDVELQKLEPPRWYNPWWWVGLPVPPLGVSVLPGPLPGEKWAEDFAVALHAGETARLAADTAVRNEAESVARRLAEIAAESIKRAAKVS